MAQRLKTDWILFSTVVLMVIFGAVMVYSASCVVAEMRMGSSYYFAMRQAIWIAIAIPLMMFFKRLHYRKLQTPAVAFTVMSVVMILLAAAYFADPRQHRWIRFGAVGGLQPSEFAKPAIVLFLAFFIAQRSRAINSRFTLLPAILAVGFITSAVVVADLGTPIVLVSTAAAMFCVAGLERRYIFAAAVVAVLACCAAVAAKPYRLVRVVSYVDPQFGWWTRFDTHGWIRAQMKKTITARDTNYQVGAGENRGGFGRPGGRGTDAGPPEIVLPAGIAHRHDLRGGRRRVRAFRLAGGAGRIHRHFVARHSRHGADPGRIRALSGAGYYDHVVIQAFFNISVVLGMVPTKGIPLPMISFGGSSLLVTLASLGILLNVSENRG